MLNCSISLQIVYILCERLVKLTHITNTARKRKKNRPLTSKDRKRSFKILKNTAPKAFNNKYNDDNIDGERQEMMQKSHCEVDIKSMGNAIVEEERIINSQEEGNMGQAMKSNKLNDNDTDSSQSMTSYEREEEIEVSR